MKSASVVAIVQPQFVNTDGRYFYWIFTYSVNFALFECSFRVFILYYCLSNQNLFIIYIEILIVTLVYRWLNETLPKELQECSYAWKTLIDAGFNFSLSLKNPIGFLP